MTGNTETNILLNKIMLHYKINSIVDLAKIFKMSQPAISHWRARNSVSAIKKKCMELNIYDKIFDEEYKSLQRTPINNTNKLPISREIMKQALIELRQKYFNENDLIEYIKTGEVARYELVKDMTPNQVSQIKDIINEQKNQEILNQIKTLGSQLILDKGEDYLSKIVKQFDSSKENDEENLKEVKRDISIRRER